MGEKLIPLVVVVESCKDIIDVAITLVNKKFVALMQTLVSHVSDEIFVYHVRMPSVKTSTKHSCNTLKDMNLAELLQLCLPGLTGNGEIDDLRLSRTLTFYTLAG